MIQSQRTMRGKYSGFKDRVLLDYLYKVLTTIYVETTSCMLGTDIHSSLLKDRFL